MSQDDLPANQAPSGFDYSGLYDRLRQAGYRRNDDYKTHLARDISWIKAYLQYESVLDIGCSTGASLPLLAASGQRSTGVDASAVAVRRALQLGRNVVQALATNLPFSDRSFDLVVSSDFFEHLHPDDVCGAVHEMVRVATRFIFVRVAPRKDRIKIWKRLAGHHLHLTIRPMEWWHSEFSPFGRLIYQAGPSFCLELT